MTRERGEAAASPEAAERSEQRIAEADRVLAELRERGFRLTAPRQLVIQVLAAADTHLCVEQIHAEVSKISSAVNLSTVHRTVATLLDEHIVHAVPTRRGLSYGLARDHHHHTLCQSCGRTTVLTGDVTYPGLPVGFHAEAMVIYGRCADCR
jgi:Fe2+ or Zn2+ uptake regulation protein